MGQIGRGGSAFWGIERQIHIDVDGWAEWEVLLEGECELGVGVEEVEEFVLE